MSQLTRYSADSLNRCAASRMARTYVSMASTIPQHSSYQQVLVERRRVSRVEGVHAIGEKPLV